MPEYCAYEKLTNKNVKNSVKKDNTIFLLREIEINFKFILFFLYLSVNFISGSAKLGNIQQLTLTITLIFNNLRDC